MPAKAGILWWMDNLQDSRLPGNDKLALYIHWPFCKAKCPYCDFNSHVREAVDGAAWKAALLAELKYFARQLPGRELISIFFGGGTPSLMPPEIAGAMIEAATNYWQPSANIEITLEANPTSVEAEKFHAFRAAGVNRVSLGVQALKAEDLKFLGREHSADEALKAVALAREIFPRTSFDLIYARPGQSVEAWEKELHEALEYADGHLSLYQLTIEQGTKFYQAVHHQKAFVMPDEALAADLYVRTQEIMEACGMPAYEISNHAKPGQESRHNLAYWRGYEYVGVGPGAHGRLSCGSPQARAQDLVKEFRDSVLARCATQNFRSPEKWLEMVQQQGHGVEVSQPLSSQEQFEERVMMGLRVREGLDAAGLARDFPQHALSARQLEMVQAQGLVVLENERVMPTLSGRLVLNSLTSALLRQS